jgi:tRNA pseudouridine38-40 synthase
VPRRVRIDLAYDGTAYAGWQLQSKHPTVQGTLEAALTRLHGGERVRVRGAGRTDAGVHARGQVADALVGESHSDASLERSLLAILPGDVRVLRVVTVDDAFHPQHDAVAKTYTYTVDRSRSGDPFLARYSLHEPRPLDVAAMDAALAPLPGRRDWSGFTGSACTKTDRVRTLTVARRETVRPTLDVFEFTADGFLTHMVRNLVGTLLEIGLGRMEVARMAAIVAARDRSLAAATAPPHGLCLEGVTYGVGCAPR